MADTTVGATKLGRAAGSMAAGTALSRASGVVRVLVLAYVLGLTPVADAFNLANTVPNMLFDLVLGGVLSATFIPVFVNQLESRSPKDAWRSISAVCTLAFCLLVVTTVACYVLAPQIISAFSVVAEHGATATPQLALQQHLAAVLLRCFVPQVFCYGLIGIMTALLNTQRVFGPPAWVPVANNVVCVAVLLWFKGVQPDLSVASINANSHYLLLLGLGTSLGVAVQAGLLVPFILKAKLRWLWWRFDPRDRAVALVARLGAWTFGFVVLNQVALFVVLALAFGLGGNGQVSAYSYAWIFMQTPYAIVAISVLSAVTPELAALWSRGDLVGYRRRFLGGLRAVLAIIVPGSVLMFVVAHPAMELLFTGHGSSPAMVHGAGAALAAFALGLPGFSVFQFVIRALQTMRQLRTAFWLYALENGVNIAVALVVYHSLGVGGLALSVSVAYSIAAVVGLVVLSRRLGATSNDRSVLAPLGPVLVSSAILGVFALVAVNLSASTTTVALVVRLGLGVVAGGCAYGVSLGILRHLWR